VLNPLKAKERFSFLKQMANRERTVLPAGPDGWQELIGYLQLLTASAVFTIVWQNSLAGRTCGRRAICRKSMHPSCCEPKKMSLGGGWVVAVLKNGSWVVTVVNLKLCYLLLLTKQAMLATQKIAPFGAEEASTCGFSTREIAGRHGPIHSPCQE
jgi:hypothetical protein